MLERASMTIEGFSGRSRALVLIAGAAGAFLPAQLALELTSLGHLSRHMTTHILLMSVVAPAAAGAWLALSRSVPRMPFVGSLWPATVAQLTTLWLWHTPVLLHLALSRPTFHLLMQGSLFSSSFWFWMAVFKPRGNERWRSIFALLITAKLFCLVGILLVFARRALYADSGDAVLSMHSVNDQQLAGLLMLVACPLTYLVASVVIASRWLKELEVRSDTQRVQLVDGPG